MILFDDMNVIEAKDGEIYLTSLYNFAQPLIRYRITDNFMLKEAEENSLYPFTKAVGLLGRSEDILWFTDQGGNREFLHPLAIEGFCIEGLLDYQFRQTSVESFEMFAQASHLALIDKIRGEMLWQMNKILVEKKLAYVQYSVIFVEQISPDLQTGKKRLIVPETTEARLVV